MANSSDSSDNLANSNPTPPAWVCPHSCPYQADDGLSALIGRVSLPILTGLCIMWFWAPIIHQEKRSLTQQEFGIGLVALFLSYQPTLFGEIAKKFIPNHTAEK
ncbi:MAG: hypothetical protein KME11_05185 [Timaviella obliquedivisa GSE-PSE-MK23-08B]|nr:hypothetical protein [Timaviella obliquedivisa GSE-PSE-MK23-08B]